MALNMAATTGIGPVRLSVAVPVSTGNTSIPTMFVGAAIEQSRTPPPSLQQRRRILYHLISKPVLRFLGRQWLDPVLAVSSEQLKFWLWHLREQAQSNE